MNPLELYNFIKEVFRWDADHFAAFLTGAISGLLAAWVVQRWMFPRRGDGRLIRQLRKNIHLLEKEKETLKQANARLDNDLQRGKEDNRTFQERLSTAASERDRLKALNEEQIKANELLENRLRTALEELVEARGSTDNLKAQVCSLEAANRQRQVKVEELSEECSKLKETLSDSDDEKRQAVAQLKELTIILKRTRKKASDLQNQIDNLTRQIDCVAKSDGRIWEREPIATPKPRLAGAPRAPIIAVINLKGGVGKTTLTANLGASLWTQGKRVLLVDLDYQSSLSTLCLPPERFSKVRADGRFVQKMFRPQWPGAAGLNDLLIPLGHDLAFLLAADDDLQEVETQVQARWLVKSGGVDARLLLRQTLHAPEIQKDFDFILLDCPPRLTTAGINALVCSDYALIPVQLDPTSAYAVPRLLHWLRQRQQALCPELSILGVVANRVSMRNEALVKGEQNIWNELPKSCEDIWGKPVHFFKTLIKQDSAIAKAAGKHCFAAFDSGMNSLFLDLAKEVRRRIDTHERSRVATVCEESHPASPHIGR